MERRIEFYSQGQKIAGNLHLPDGGSGPFPCVVVSHGYMANSGSEKYLQIGYRFPLAGIAVLRFDHRGALGGESQGKFEDTTLTGRVKD
ncbi:MAG: acetylxylan esterase, partial [Chloroflexota bacterium]